MGIILNCFIQELLPVHSSVTCVRCFCVCVCVFIVVCIYYMGIKWSYDMIWLYVADVECRRVLMELLLWLAGVELTDGEGWCIIIIIVQQLLQLLTGYALNKVSVLLLSQKHFPDICIYCWQFSKAMSQLKYTSQPPFPPPLPPKSMHQVIDIPEMPGISLLLFSFSFFLFPSLFPSLSFFFFWWGRGVGG